MMTAKETVKASIEHRESDTVPYHIDVTPPVTRALAKRYGLDSSSPSVGIGEVIGNYLLMVAGATEKPLYASPEDFGDLLKDEFGVVWRTSSFDRGYVAEHPLTEPTLDGYTFPDPLREGRFDGLKEQIASNADLFVVGVAGDLFERAYFMRGYMELMEDLLLRPRFAHELLDGICEYNMKTLSALAKLNIDAIFISDDYGLQDRLMMRPELWREFIQPPLARLITAAKKAGLVTILHSCGCVRTIIPDLIEIGLDVLHPIQPEAMDVFDLKREFGRDISFFGGIGTQRLLRDGAPAEVAAEARKTRDALARGGGYILGPGITIQHDCPIENVIALIETAREGI